MPVSRTLMYIMEMKKRDKLRGFLSKIYLDSYSRFCKDNPNKKFADCSVPQEKTDSEINAELEIADGSLCEEDEKDSPIDSKFSNDVECQSKD
jgi:hypothetical protein